MKNQYTIFSSLTKKLKSLATSYSKSQNKISDVEYTELIKKICKQISKSGWRPSYVVAISRGGAIPAVMISHYLNIKMYSLDIDLNDHSSSTSNLWMAEEAFGYTPKDELDESLHFEISGIPASSARARRDILIVSDINNQGSTFNWLVEDWKSGCFPNDPKWDSVWNQNVKFAAVINNTTSKSNVKVDFVGKEINKDKNNSWIKFPYEEWWK